MEYVNKSHMMRSIALFLFGSSIILGGGANLGQDSWISTLLSVVIFIPVMLIYCRIIVLYPEKDIYEIMEILFGKILSKIMIILFMWYCIHLGALVLKNFTSFITTAQMDATPEVVIGLCMIVSTIFIAKSGMKTVGKWASVLFPAAVLILLLTVVIAVKYFDIEHFMPLLVHSPMEILEGAIQNYAFPYAETVVFLALASSIRKEDSPRKIYSQAVIIITILFLLVIFRNLSVLGQGVITREHYPSFSTLRIIRISNTLTRFESTIALNFIIGGLGKVAFCTIAASKGIARLISFDDYKRLVAPSALVIAMLASVIYENEVQMFSFSKIYPIYALPFQVIIPLIIWITAEIKMRINNKKKADTPAG